MVAPLVLDDVTTPAGAYRGELGGSATYAALAARHFAPTAIAAVVGEDFPPAYLERLTGIDLSHVERVAGPSFRWIAEQRADGTTATRTNDPGATAGRLPALGDLSDAWVLVGALEPAVQARVGPARFIAVDTMPCYIDEDARRRRGLRAPHARGGRAPHRFAARPPHPAAARRAPGRPQVGPVRRGRVPGG